ncbi:MAG: hypothetical protein ACFFAU_04705 [Candidatus Hodarchaeota archaeon]
MDSNYKNKNLIFNIGSLSSGRIFLLASGAIFWLLAANLFYDHEVGIGAALIATTVLASSLSNLGINFWVTQYFEENEIVLSSYLLVIFIFIFITSIFINIILFLISNLFIPELNRIVSNNPFLGVILIIGTFSNTVIFILETIEIRLEHGKIVLVQNIIWGTLRVLFLFFLRDANGIGLYLAWLSSLIISGTVFSNHIISLFKKNLLFPPKNQISFSLKQYLIAQINSVPVYSLPLLVFAKFGSSFTGKFQIIYNLASLFMIISMPLTRLAYVQYVKFKYEFERGIQSFFTFLILNLGFGIIFLFINLIFSKQILSIYNIPSESNLENIILLGLSMYIILSSSTLLTSNLIRTWEKNLVVLIISLMKLILVYSLFLFFTTFFAHLGIILAMVIEEVTIFVFCLIFTMKSIFWKKDSVDRNSVGVR